MAESGEKETWNMATATLKRFDFLLKQSSVHSQRGDLISWKATLMDMRRNLYAFMTDKEFDEVNEKFESIPNNWRLGNGAINKKLFPETNQIFDEIYMFFIKIMKEKGLLMPKTKDSGKAVIEM